MHYVVYKFYRKHGEDRGMSMIYTCCLHLVLDFILVYLSIATIDVIIGFLENKSFEFIIAIGGISFVFLIEYLCLLRNYRYYDLFTEFDDLSETPEMRSKLSIAKLVNLLIFLCDLAMLFYVDYCNNH